MKGRCIVAGAGEWTHPAPVVGEGDFVIAADGGYERLRKDGIRADLIVGDFDSAPPPSAGRVVQLPREKDDTDMLAALRIGLLKGYDAFHIYGGTGGRFDHTLANIQCLHFLSREGARGYLYARDCTMTVIEASRIRFARGAQGILSAFSLTDTAQGVCIEGMKYPLSGATLTSTYPVGVSNQFTGAPASVSVEAGALLIVFARAIQITEEK